MNRLIACFCLLLAASAVQAERLKDLASIQGVRANQLIGYGTVLQNTLENSNVSVVEELVNMITTQRAYEMNSKVISTADQMLSFITQNL